MAVPGYEKKFPEAAEASNVVAMRAKEWRVFEVEIEAKPKARLQSSMEEYCEHGPEALPETLFKFLEHYERHGVKVRLEEFKAKGVRLFGFRGNDRGQPTFFVTGSDTDKKRKKANQTLVDLAGREAVRIVGILRKQIAKAKGKQR